MNKFIVCYNDDDDSSTYDQFLPVKCDSKELLITALEDALQKYTKCEFHGDFDSQGYLNYLDDFFALRHPILFGRKFDLSNLISNTWNLDKTCWDRKLDIKVMTLDEWFDANTSIDSL